MNTIGFMMVVKREVSRFLRIWQQTLIPPIITSLLFILIFGYSLGSRFSFAGFSYLEFILPGLLMMGMIMSAYSQSSSSLYISKFQGNVQEYLVAPLSYWQIIFGYTIAGVLRALLVGVGILGIGFIFSSITLGNVFILLYFAVMVSLLFSFAGIATGLWANSFDQVNVFATFVITPFTYLGGVFYSLSVLPPFWQVAVKFNPIFYMVDGFRYAFIGVHDVPLAYSMGIVLLLTLFFFVLCVHLFRVGYKIRT